LKQEIKLIHFAFQLQRSIHIQQIASTIRIHPPPQPQQLDQLGGDGEKRSYRTLATFLTPSL
jgi:hypothetical protein